MFYLGSLWHGGGANRTGRPRIGVILEYVVAWLRSQEALRRGDWATYGAEQKRLEEALRALAEPRR